MALDHPREKEGVARNRPGRHARARTDGKRPVRARACVCVCVNRGGERQRARLRVCVCVCVRLRVWVAPWTPAGPSVKLVLSLQRPSLSVWPFIPRLVYSLSVRDVYL